MHKRAKVAMFHVLVLNSFNILFYFQKFSLLKNVITQSLLKIATNFKMACYFLHVKSCNLVCTLNYMKAKPRWLKKKLGILVVHHRPRYIHRANTTQVVKFLQHS